MVRVGGMLWVASAGAVLGLVSLGSSFYMFEGEARDAWFGVPHASQLLVAASLITLLLTASLVAGRNPVRGRTAGSLVGVAGTLITLHLAYRMAAPPFEFGELPPRVTILHVFTSCLGYCSPAQAADVQLLPGIYLAVTGAAMIAIGGWSYAASRRAAHVPARPTVAAEQAGLTPWLGLAGVGALGQFLFGFTIFTFHLVAMEDGGQRAWSGWYGMPHTAVLVLWSTVLVVGSVIFAARGRAPLRPRSLGAAVALLGLLAATRIASRMIESPFGAGTVPTDLGLGAYLSLASAVMVILGGAVHAWTTRTAADEVAAPRD